MFHSGPTSPSSPEAPQTQSSLSTHGARRPLSPALRVGGALILAVALFVAALGFGSEAPLDSERALVQAHLAEVEAALRAAPTDHLDADRRANRAALLDELRAYRRAGTFPRNVEVTGRSPVFVDDDGVHCAVGYLIHRSGGDDLVAAVAASRNHARIFDLLDEPALVTWLEESGLSAVEAAWIQPAYCNLDARAGLSSVWYGCPPWPNPGREELSREYLGLTVGTSTLSAALATVNVLDLGAGHPSAGRGLLGMGVGAAGVGLGAAGILDGGDARRAGWVNVAFGALGVGTGAWTFHRARVHENEAPGGQRVVADDATGPILSIRPWVPTGQARASPEAVGLSVRIAH